MSNRFVSGIFLILIVVIIVAVTYFKYVPYGTVDEITPLPNYKEFWLVQKDGTNKPILMESYIGDRYRITLKHWSGKSYSYDNIIVSPEFAKKIKVGDYIEGSEK